MKHLRGYIGIYLASIITFAIVFNDSNADLIWWFMLAAVVCICPPFNVKDRFVNVLGRFFMFILQPFHRWQAKWPKWIKVLFAIIVLILFEEYFLQPLGQTMYPWRMDFSG
jgi:hypothetical protein